MNFRECIDRAERDKKISKEKADRARAIFEEELERLQGTMHDAAAEAEAGARAWGYMNHDLAEKKRQTLLQVKTWQRIDADMKQYRNGRGEEDLGKALTAHLSYDDRAPFSNLEARRKSVLGRLHAGMDEALASFRRNLAGQVQNKATLSNVVRELFGADTGDQAAKEFSQAWSETAEKARQRYNAAGGRIPKRSDWGLPQAHDSVAVGKVAYSEWRDFIRPLLDPAKMVNEESGLPFTGEQLELALRNVYETIRTDGLNKTKPGRGNRMAMLANRRTDHRFLVFKDADSWLQYNGRFGRSDPFSVMMGHLDHMARDISALEILGPNPTATLRYMEDLARKWSVDAGKRDGTESEINLAQNMWSIYTGSTNAPVHGAIARGLASTRALLQAAQLGSAAISSVTDLNTGRMARKMSGLPQARMIPQILKLLNPADLGDQKLAVRLGLIAENWSQQALAQQRYVGEMWTPNTARVISDAVLRVSGLNAWTQAGRWSFGMEFMGFLADHAGKTFDALPKGMQDTMKRYGIGAERWDVIRTTAAYEHEGATFIRPEDVASRGDLLPGIADDHAQRLLEMIQTETEFAVPSATLRGRAQMQANTRPGTLIGEIVRSFGMYKNFSFSLYHTHITRAMLQQGLQNKLGYMSSMVISTTLAGAVSMQLKEIAKGRDPRNMFGEDAAAFWGQALIQGGGLGIFGDFLSSSTNRTGNTLGETIAGPVAALAGDVASATLGNAKKFAKGEETTVGADTVRIIKKYMPGTSLWYARAAFERMVFDNIQKWVDPEALERFRRQESKLRNEARQKYWWRPGHTLPDRAPDIGQAVGGIDD
ncbi:MAG: hypothetical protein JNM12_10110 [Alphaproteobacteria bacterium]|nr:hypothetical protein [Alphaproteobacteria bacterium]